MKLNITRIFETSRALATKAGQELTDIITYTAEAFTQVIAALRNGLTFEDNMNGLVSTVSLFEDTSQVVNTNGKTAKHVIPTRCFSFTYALDSFTWQLNGDNNLVVKATFTGTPTAAINVTLLILF